MPSTERSNYADPDDSVLDFRNEVARAVRALEGGRTAVASAILRTALSDVSGRLVAAP